MRTGIQAAGEKFLTVDPLFHFQTNAPVFLFNAYRCRSQAPKIILASYNKGVLTTGPSSPSNFQISTAGFQIQSAESMIAAAYKNSIITDQWRT